MYKIMASHDIAIFIEIVQPKFLLLRDDVPPKPAGVGYDVYQVIPKHTFGFAGSGGQNFNNGVFQPYGGPVDAYSLDS